MILWLLFTEYVSSMTMSYYMEPYLHDIVVVVYSICEFYDHVVLHGAVHGASRPPTDLRQALHRNFISRYVTGKIHL